MSLAFPVLYGVLKSKVLTICDECGEALTFLVGGPIGVMERVSVAVVLTIGSETVCINPDDDDDVTALVKGAGKAEDDDDSCLVGDEAEDFRAFEEFSFDPLSFEAKVPVDEACDVTTVAVGALAIEFFRA